MLKMVLCCGGGFSSSYVVERMKKEIRENQLENEVFIEFSPFSLALDKMHDYDIVICCPHLYIYVKRLAQMQSLPIPFYILPPRMYGMMEIKEIYQDAKDIIHIFRKSGENPVHFPGEENVLKITRKCAYSHEK